MAKRRAEHGDKLGDRWESEIHVVDAQLSIDLSVFTVNPIAWDNRNNPMQLTALSVRNRRLQKSQRAPLPQRVRRPRKSSAAAGRSECVRLNLAQDTEMPSSSAPLVETVLDYIDSSDEEDDVVEYIPRSSHGGSEEDRDDHRPHPDLSPD